MITLCSVYPYNVFTNKDKSKLITIKNQKEEQEYMNKNTITCTNENCKKYMKPIPKHMEHEICPWCGPSAYHVFCEMNEEIAEQIYLEKLRSH